MLAGLKSEAAVSCFHTDNIAPAVLGNFTLVRWDQMFVESLNVAAMTGSNKSFEAAVSGYHTSDIKCAIPGKFSLVMWVLCRFCSDWYFGPHMWRKTTVCGVHLKSPQSSVGSYHRVTFGVQVAASTCDLDLAELQVLTSDLSKLPPTCRAPAHFILVCHSFDATCLQAPDLWCMMHSQRQTAPAFEMLAFGSSVHRRPSGGPNTCSQ